MTVRVLLAGATGLVGGRVARLLAARADMELHVLLRREWDSVPEAVTCHVADTGEWTSLISEIAPEVVISTLGTTIRTAGSREAFAAVDRDLVAAVAEAAKQSGARHCIAVSSVGASAASSNFYLRTKGEAEERLAQCGFESIDILQPSLLVGDRAESRPGERIAIVLSPVTDLLMLGPLRRYRSIGAETVARAIVALVGTNTIGHFVHENPAIEKLAGAA